jgi:hypothetical protein
MLTHCPVRSTHVPHKLAESPHGQTVVCSVSRPGHEASAINQCFHADFANYMQHNLANRVIKWLGSRALGAKG